jgi:flagellar hook-associated protein 3 FlgL
VIVRNNPQFSAEQSAARLASIRARLDRATSVAVSGTDITRPSDAAGAWRTLHGLSAGIEDQQTFLDNGRSARDLLDTADQALGSVHDLLNRARERAVQFANDTYSLEQRTAAAGEIASLREDLVALSNTKVGDRFLFAGDAYDAAAFDAAGVYQGAAATGTTRVGENQDVETTIDGSAVFQGGVDVFQVLADLEAALAANDPDAVAATLDPLEAAQIQVTTARQDVGYRQVRVDDAAAVATNLALLLEGRLTEHTSVDPTASFTELAQLQTTYQSALQVTAAGSGTKLFDFIK